MGTKNKYLIIIILLLPVLVHAQDKPDFISIDSTTFKYYNSGNWNKLIEAGKNAIAYGVDYKFLRQRLGYAYFSKGNYFESRAHFEKALTYDSYDYFTLEYLYYSYLKTGKEEYSGIVASKLNSDLKNKLTLSPFKPVESIEFEYNYKFSGTILRSNPQYYRIGIYTKLGYRLSLYQSFSKYVQDLRLQQTGVTANISVRQPEYFAQINWNASGKLILRAAYHFINTNSGNLLQKGNLFLLAAAPDFNRLTLETYGSLLDIEGNLFYQAGLQAGYVFRGRMDFYIKGKASFLQQSGSRNFIYNPKAGLKVFKRTWFEGSTTFGRMDGYNDFNGLYVYNSYDPVISRSGGTLFHYFGENIIIWLNFTFEKKEFYENNSFRYNQFSYLGGIKWKL